MQESHLNKNKENSENTRQKIDRIIDNMIESGHRDAEAPINLSQERLLRIRRGGITTTLKNWLA